MLREWNFYFIYTPLLHAVHDLDFDMMKLLIARGAHLRLASTEISSNVFGYCVTYYSPFFSKAYDLAGSQHLSLLLSVYDANSKLEFAWLCKGLKDALNGQSHSCVKVLIDHVSNACCFLPGWAFPFEDLLSALHDK